MLVMFQLYDIFSDCEKKNILEFFSQHLLDRKRPKKEEIEYYFKVELEPNFLKQLLDI